MGKKNKDLIKFKIKRFSYYAGFVFLILLYAFIEYATRQISISNRFIILGGQRVFVPTLAGVFSSIGSLIFIVMVIFYRGFGFYSSLTVLGFRLLHLLISLFNKQLPVWSGLFTTLISLVSIILIYHGNERFIKVQEEHKNSLEDFVHSIVTALVNCIDGKDSYTNGHSMRVAKYTKMLAKKLGEKPETVEQFYNIALLHDVGKIGIPDTILNKPGKLTDEEFAVMKSHAQRGFEILKDVKVQEGIAAGAHYHHEHFDGNGYPDKISGEDIPWVARIIAVADTLDAMSSTRPYRKKLSLDYIVQEIKRCSGTQFDPVVVKAFLELYNEGAFDDLIEQQKQAV
jgi:putative nucleotidyltransferase with HDIG domain